jgi:hypothetical protein
MERSGYAAFERVGRWVRWMIVRPAFESGGGLAPTTALQDAGARFGRSRAKSATFWSAELSIVGTDPFGAVHRVRTRV